MTDDLQDSRERFNAVAAGWDGNPIAGRISREVLAALAQLPELSPTAAPGLRVLDYGCGTGSVALPLAPEVARLAAWDSSPGMIEVLSGKARDAGLKNLVPQVVDLTTAAAPEQDFDLIYSAMALHHIPDTGAILQRLHALLRDGGRLCLVDLDTENGSFHPPGVPGIYHHGFARDALQALLRAAGFRETQAEDLHQLEKPNAQGELHSYSLFLISAWR